MSLNADWYVEQETPSKSKAKSSIFNFWKRKNNLPVTETDKQWIERSIVFLAEMFGPEYFKALITITPEKKHFNTYFKGTEEDAEFILERLISIMHIDSWEIRLMFYSNRPTSFSDGIVATPSEKLHGSWKSSSGKYVDKGLVHKGIWIETSQLNDPIRLTATIAHELAHYKLLGEYRIEENDELLTDLTAIAFGFGIFMGNSYFKFTQWTGSSHQGWKMQKRGYLPEQVIAYAMAYLAHYRNEDISWKHYLNKTMKKYFEQSYNYIEQQRNAK